MEARVRINQNGRVVIPAEFREALDIHPGDELELRLDDRELRLTTRKQRILKAQRLIRQHVDANRSLSNELIAERRKAARNE